ncbi:cobyric acid synthase CobQ [Halobacteriales archaeon SW_6_65_46]|nr:MAG: cobyric acid synthase CobQ [Halobacteriales archaeon SW_6_65_46]
MTRTLLVAGTASHVGKSTVAAGLCRLLADRGYDVAPFKAQNMSNNARAVTATVGTEPYGEIGVSQYVQARAARCPPTTDHNPVLLKPRGDGESQLVVNGRPVANASVADYYDDHWTEAREAAVAAHARLASDNELIIAEGAGSVAEPNLLHRDLANVETARFGDAEILLVADIERGGVFAHLVGTLELMPDDLEARVAGVVITKFRGSRDLLDPGIEDLEARTGVPVLGVVPYDDPGLPEEDSVGIPDPGGARSRPESGVTIGVVRLSHISNATDVEPLADTPGVDLAYLSPDAPLDCDALVIPGTKNTVDDLQELHAADFGDRLAAFDGPTVGICGGYQMLGERLRGADVEGTGDTETVAGFGSLPVETTFSAEKRVTQTSVAVEGRGPIAGATGTASGYEIHAGETRRLADVPAPLGPDSAVSGDTLGTYLHGLFENEPLREAFLDTVFASAGVERPPDESSETNPYDAAGRLVDEHVDTEPLEPSTPP